MKTKQAWVIGQQVKVGFLSLTYVADAVSRDDKYLPWGKLLRSAKGKFYHFIPHNGLTEVTEVEFNKLMGRTREV